ncbi:MAG: hypothetical protein AAF696_23455 [Bacteroidota bacterium]
MKNLAKSYISNCRAHLFTKDGKSFLKIMLLGDRAYCLYLSKSKIRIETISLLDQYNLVSLAEKVYLDPLLKYRIFSSFGGKYAAVRAPRPLKDALLGMEQMLGMDAKEEIQMKIKLKEILRDFAEQET